MTGVSITERQRDVLAAIFAAERDTPEGKTFRGLMAWQVRDRIYPADSPMRTKRTSGHHGSNHNGAVGATGNLAAGRLLHALERKGLVRQGEFRSGDYRWNLTDAGRQIVRPATLLELHQRGEI